MDYSESFMARHVADIECSIFGCWDDLEYMVKVYTWCFLTEDVRFTTMREF